MNSIKFWTNLSTRSANHAEKVGDDFAKSAAIFAIKSYQVTLGPFLGGNCRYFPSCSHYAADAYMNHSFIDATKFVVKRVSRCHPFGGSGYDPVPEKGNLP